MAFCAVSEPVDVLLRSLASAVLGSTPYLTELVIGNAAFAFLERGVSWRWAFAGSGVLVFVAGVVLYLSLREPPVGRFITKSKASARLRFIHDPGDWEPEHFWKEKALCLTEIHHQ